MAEQFDLIVIGAGPGGYPAALKAAEFGKRVAVIETGKLGGTCLNRGCIPTKTLLHTSELYREVRDANAQAAGLCISGISVDAGKLAERKNQVVAELRSGIEKQFKKNRIEWFQGRAVIVNAGQVSVQERDGSINNLTGHFILAAPGSRPACPPIPGADLPGVLDSDGLLEKSDGFFEHLLIIGGGVIGMEFATLYSDMGRQVTVIEAMDRILPGMDKEISQNLKMIMKKRGVECHTKSVVHSIEKVENGLCCIFGDEGQRVIADGVLISTGRRPNTEALFSETMEQKPEIERGYIKTDDDFRTRVPGIYAVGDCIGKVQLAHAATAAGIHAVEHMFQKEHIQDMKVVPGCVYTSPEIAVVGLSTEEAKEKGIPVKTGKYIMSVNGRSLLSMQERGFIKLVAEAKSGRLVGAALMCARATDICGELGLAISKGLTAREVAAVIMAHPTFSEGVGEAAWEIVKQE